MFRCVDTVVAMYFNRYHCKILLLLLLANLKEGGGDSSQAGARSQKAAGQTTLPDFIPPSGDYFHSYLLSFPQIRCLFPEAFTFTWASTERLGRLSYRLLVRERGVLSVTSDMPGVS